MDSWDLKVLILYFWKVFDIFATHTWTAKLRFLNNPITLNFQKHNLIFFNLVSYLILLLTNAHTSLPPSYGHWSGFLGIICSMPSRACKTFGWCSSGFQSGSQNKVAKGCGYVQLLTRAHNRKLTITRFLYIVDVTTITTILQNENVAVNALATNWKSIWTSYCSPL